MAVPKVFVSSTYYDLKQYRNNIESFILSLGYDPIMHERSKVAYTHNHALELDCYHEISICDIIVCIIGNHFGTKSSESDLSITMEELKTALKNKKKIYVFISNDVFIENRTYKLNRNNESFKSAYTDNIKIHEYIAQLTEVVKNHVIAPFETTEQIVAVLKAQFAGLFQNMLARESSLTEAKTAYDLQETADNINKAVADFLVEKDEFFLRFNSFYFQKNQTLFVLKQKIGLKHASFFADDLLSLKEIITKFGYSVSENRESDELIRFNKLYRYDNNEVKVSIGLTSNLFDENNKLVMVKDRQFAEDNIRYSNTVISQHYEEDLPF